MRFRTSLRSGEDFRTWFSIKIAWALPRRVALWAMIRVAAHATTGRWGSEPPDRVGFKEMHDRWAITD